MLWVADVIPCQLAIWQSGLDEILYLLHSHIKRTSLVGNCAIIRMIRNHCCKSSMCWVFYSHNIRPIMTLFTLLLFCACCFICRLYSYMDCFMLGLTFLRFI